LKQVLVVDDDEDDCELFCDAIASVNADVACTKALSGKSAMKLLSTDYKPDFIFLDLNMPMFDGKTCITEIRKIETLKDVPVVIYTTSKLKKDKEEMKELGAVHFITKPTSLAALCGEISFVLDEKWRDTSLNAIGELGV
jgi:CheY-like chemotaxis protein